MAKETFDFQAFQDLKYVEYKKKHAKTQVVKKSKAALVLHKYDLGSKKKMTLIIPFKKMDEATLAFKALKNDKSIHLVKFTSLVKVSQGEKEVILEIKKGGLTAEVIQTELQDLFDKVVMLGLTVIGLPEGSDEEASEGVSDTVTDESTIQELTKAFQQLKQMYKQVGTVDAKLKAKTMLDAWNQLEDLVPKLENFISSSDKAAQTEAATKITAAVQKIKANLKPLINKIKESGKGKKSDETNGSLEALTSGIGNQATQLLKSFQSEISSIDGLVEKLKTLSQLA